MNEDGQRRRPRAVPAGALHWSSYLLNTPSTGTWPSPGHLLSQALSPLLASLIAWPLNGGIPRAHPASLLFFIFTPCHSAPISYHDFNQTRGRLNWWWNLLDNYTGGKNGIGLSWASEKVWLLDSVHKCLLGLHCQSRSTCLPELATGASAILPSDVYVTFHT